MLVNRNRADRHLSLGLFGDCEKIDGTTQCFFMICDDKFSVIVKANIFCDSHS